MRRCAKLDVPENYGVNGLDMQGAAYVPTRKGALEFEDARSFPNGARKEDQLASARFLARGGSCPKFFSGEYRFSGKRRENSAENQDRGSCYGHLTGRRLITASETELDHRRQITCTSELQ